MKFINGFGSECKWIFALVEPGLPLEFDFVPDRGVLGESFECFNHQEYIYKWILKSNPIICRIMRRIRMSLDLEFWFCFQTRFCALWETCKHFLSSCCLKTACPSNRTRLRTSLVLVQCGMTYSIYSDAPALSSSFEDSSFGSPHTSPSPYPHITHLYYSSDLQLPGPGPWFFLKISGNPSLPLME